jgi:DNA-binding transcriptional LysR family regulator
MNLRHIEIIHALMRASSMTEAAQNLNISQPAVSIMLKRAESQLGIKLFQRVSGRLRPTSEALVIFEEIEGIFARLDTLKRVAQNLRDAQSGSLSLAASPSLASGYIPRIVAAFQKDRPSVTIDIQSMPSVRVVDAVNRREVDLGFCYQTSPDVGASAEIVGVAEIGCVLPADSALAEKRTIEPADLAGERLISYRGRSPFGRQLQAAFDRAEVPLTLSTEIHNSAEAIFLVMAGAGIALVDPILMGPYTLPQVVVREFRPRVGVPLQLLFPSGRPSSRLVMQFAEHVRTCRERRGPRPPAPAARAGSSPSRAL